VEDALAHAFEITVGPTQIRQLAGHGVLDVGVLASAALQQQPDFDLVVFPLLEMNDGRSRAKVPDDCRICSEGAIEGLGVAAASVQRGQRLFGTHPVWTEGFPFCFLRERVAEHATFEQTNTVTLMGHFYWRETGDISIG
jgi:hypothetical protein